MLQPGREHQMTWVVARDHLASAFGSGLVDVLATPVLVGFCEECSRQMVEPHLPVGQRTVGTAVSIEHLAATPEGMSVTVIARLDDVDRRRLTFHVEARDDVELVGRGTHVRFVIDDERFAAGLEAKRAKWQSP